MLERFILVLNRIFCVGRSILWILFYPTFSLCKQGTPGPQRNRCRAQSVSLYHQKIITYIGLSATPTRTEKVLDALPCLVNKTKHLIFLLFSFDGAVLNMLLAIHSFCPLSNLVDQFCGDDENKTVAGTIFQLKYLTSDLGRNL